jgi:ribonuclease VapC
VIVIDSSALFAILHEELEAERCRSAIKATPVLAISAGTLAEALIVAAGRKLGAELIALLDLSDIEIVPVDSQAAVSMSLAYQRWGRGFHPAKLNFGDCFAYVLAMERSWPLLYVGNDFAQTDVTSA